MPKIDREKLEYLFKHQHMKKNDKPITGPVQLARALEIKTKDGEVNDWIVSQWLIRNSVPSKWVPMICALCHLSIEDWFSSDTIMAFRSLFTGSAWDKLIEEMEGDRLKNEDQGKRIDLITLPEGAMRLPNLGDNLPSPRRRPSRPDIVQLNCNQRFHIDIKAPSIEYANERWADGRLWLFAYDKHLRDCHCYIPAAISTTYFKGPLYPQQCGSFRVTMKPIRPGIKDQGIFWIICCITKETVPKDFSQLFEDNYKTTLTNPNTLREFDEFATWIASEQQAGRLDLMVRPYEVND
jgi:hypothetical protein